MNAAEGCDSCTQNTFGGVGGNPHGPEEAAGEWRDAGVEVVDLRREVGEVKLTLKDIQSDKAEGVVMDLAVYTDIFALHEAHVGIEEQAIGPGALDLGRADEAIEVGDCRGFLAAWIEDVERRSRGDSLGYGLRRDERPIGKG